MMNRAMAAAAVLAVLAGLFGATGPAGAQAGPGPGTPGGSSSTAPAAPAVTGTFRLLYVDPPSGSDRTFGPPVPVIESATGTLRLDQSQVPPGVEPGDTVRLDAPGGHVEVTHEGLSTADVATGTHRLLLAMVSWSGHPADTMTAARASTALATNRTWYQTASAGRLDMPATVQDWLPIATPTGSCTDVDWYSFSFSLRDNARAALTAQGYDLATYDSVILYFADAGCPYGGLGGGGTVWTNGYLSQGLVVHELGHELGLGHAGILDCTDGESGPAVPLSTTCVADEYADYTDTMGASDALFDGPHLDELGWFGSGELAVVSPPASGTTNLSRELVPLESPGVGLRQVRIANADGSSYWLENRQPIGIDADVFNAGQAGMRLHFTPSPAAHIPCTGNISGCADDSYLLNPAAGLPVDTGSFELEPGVPWTSPDDSVTVTARTATGDHMAVDLQIAPSTGVAPVVTSVTPTDDQAALTWTPGTGSLGAPATGYLVTISVRPPRGDGWSYTQALPSTELSATITGLPRGYLANFRVAATNAMGNGPNSPATSDLLVGAPLPPTGTHATAGNAAAVVSWAAPADNGSAAITGYVVTPYVGAVAQPARTFNSTATSQNVTGLTSGTTYTFTVAARNQWGVGPVSAASNAVTARPPDVTNPTVDLRTPPDRTIYAQNQAATADYTCADEAGGSGIATCVGTVGDGSPIDTSSPGSRDFTVTAVDNAGNVTEVTHTYTTRSPQPDLRLKFGHSYWFDNVYNTTGDGVTGSPGTTFTHIVSVQNDGFLSEPLRIKASASTPGLILQYFTGGADITAQVAAGTYRTRTLATGATQNIRVVARLTGSAPRNVWMSRSITAISTIDTHRKDRLTLGYLRYL